MGWAHQYSHNDTVLHAFGSHWWTTQSYISQLFVCVCVSLTWPDWGRTSPPPSPGAPAQDTQSRGTGCSPRTLTGETPHKCVGFAASLRHPHQLNTEGFILTDELIWCLISHHGNPENPRIWFIAVSKTGTHVACIYIQSNEWHTNVNSPLTSVISC